MRCDVRMIPCETHFGHNCMCHRSRTFFFVRPPRYANERYRSKDFCVLSFTSVRSEAKKGGAVSKEKANKSFRPAAKECSYEREKEKEKANLIKLMQRTNRRPQTHLTKFYIIICCCVWVRACVLLHGFLLKAEGRRRLPLSLPLAFGSRASANFDRFFIPLMEMHFFNLRSAPLLFLV